MSADGEELITTFLSALVAVERSIRGRAADLSRTDELSGVTYDVEVTEFGLDDTDKRVAITAYVDGELAGVGGLAWYVRLIRRHSGWELERELLLNATQNQETIRELPVVELADSREAARRLPDLVDELLAVPPPR
jgi:hypothetical protein